MPPQHQTKNSENWGVLGGGGGAVILLPAHHASFAHNFVSGMQSFNFSESQDAIASQTCH